MQPPPFGYNNFQAHDRHSSFQNTANGHGQQQTNFAAPVNDLGAAASPSGQFSSGFQDYSASYGQSSFVLDQQLESEFSELVNSLNSVTDTLSNSGPGKATAELQTQVRLKSRALKGLLQQLEDVAEDLVRNEESEEAIMELARYQKQYNETQQAYRKATLQMQRNVEENYRDERRLLLGCDNPAERQKKIQSEAQLAEASEDVTASLQRTRQMMTQELDHTAATLAVMDVSDTTLKGARDEFKGQKGMHKRSKQLLGTMKRHSFLDTLTVWGGFLIFMGAVAYVIGKRTSYFIPQFAKDAVAYPFRSRNATSAIPRAGLNTANADLTTTDSLLNAKFTEAEHEHEAQMQAFQEKEDARRPNYQDSLLETEVNKSQRTLDNSTAAANESSTLEEPSQSGNRTQIKTTDTPGMAHVSASNGTEQPVQDSGLKNSTDVAETKLNGEVDVRKTQSEEPNKQSVGLQESDTAPDALLGNNLPGKAASEASASRIELNTTSIPNASQADRSETQTLEDLTPANSTQSVQTNSASAALDVAQPSINKADLSLEDKQNEVHLNSSNGSGIDEPGRRVPNTSTTSNSTGPQLNGTSQEGNADLAGPSGLEVEETLSDGMSQNAGESPAGETAAPAEALQNSQPRVVPAGVASSQQTDEAYPTMYGMAQAENQGGALGSHAVSNQGDPPQPSPQTPVPAPAPSTGGLQLLGGQRPTKNGGASPTPGSQRISPGQTARTKSTGETQVPSPAPSPMGYRTAGLTGLQAASSQAAPLQQSPDAKLSSASEGQGLAPAVASPGPQSQGNAPQGMQHAQQQYSSWQGAPAAAPSIAAPGSQGYEVQGSAPQRVQNAQQRYAGWAKSKEEEGPSERAPSPTTRQEDTEIGLFRPDEL